MRLKDLCNEFWDDIVSLMDFRVIERIAGSKGCLNRIEVVRAYCMIEPDLWDVLGDYLHLDKGEITREKLMQKKAS